MGKKVISQASVKISKNDKKQQQQLNSCVKVLRPKVYITDSSSFKSLVQELTGNGSSSAKLSPNPVLPEVPRTGTVDKVVEFIDFEDQGVGFPRESRSSREASFDASAEVDSFDFCNQLSDNYIEEMNQTDSQLMYFDYDLSDHLPMNQVEDMFPCQDIGSFLEDMEQHPFSSCYSETHKEGVSIYDYELTGLL